MPQEKIISHLCPFSTRLAEEGEWEPESGGGVEPLLLGLLLTGEEGSAAGQRLEFWLKLEIINPPGHRVKATRDSDLIGLVFGLGIRNLKTCPSDFNVQPTVAENCWAQKGNVCIQSLNL